MNGIRGNARDNTHTHAHKMSTQQQRRKNIAEKMLNVEEKWLRFAISFQSTSMTKFKQNSELNRKIINNAHHIRWHNL